MTDSTQYNSTGYGPRMSRLIFDGDERRMKMSYFDTLPNEVVLHILSFLGASGLTSVRQTCRRLHELTCMDSLWETLCRQEYNFITTEDWGQIQDFEKERVENCTFYSIYSTVLHKYGNCLGLWRSTITPYGLCFSMKLGKGCLIARYLEFPETEDVRHQLQWSNPVFTVTFENNQGYVKCHKGCQSPAVHLKSQNNQLEYACDMCINRVQNLSAEEVFSEWVKEKQPDLDRGRPDLVFKKFSIARATNLWSSFCFNKIPPSVQSSVSPVRLGLYKGTYGSHGIEIIRLSLHENGYELQGDKILGDPNVPAGKISLFIDLRRPLALTADQQEFEFVNSCDPETLSSPYRFPPNASQPFSLSAEILSRDPEDLPSSCTSRYAGHGQIAAHGYNNPDKCRGQMVVFSEDHFGFYWLDLTCFSVFRLGADEFS